MLCSGSIVFRQSLFWPVLDQPEKYTLQNCTQAHQELCQFIEESHVIVSRERKHNDWLREHLFLNADMYYC